MVLKNSHQRWINEVTTWEWQADEHSIMVIIWWVRARHGSVSCNVPTIGTSREVTAMKRGGWVDCLLLTGEYRDGSAESWAKAWRKTSWPIINCLQKSHTVNSELYLIGVTSQTVPVSYSHIRPPLTWAPRPPDQIPQPTSLLPASSQTSAIPHPAQHQASYLPLPPQHPHSYLQPHDQTKQHEHDDKPASSSEAPHS